MFEDKLGGALYRDAMTLYIDVRQLFPETWVHYNQCCRSLGSIPANIAEGSGKKKTKGHYYTVFLMHSKGSLYETVAWLQMGIIDNVCPKEKTEEIIKSLMKLGDALTKELEACWSEDIT
jgi:four helix bundle protein